MSEQGRDLPSFDILLADSVTIMNTNSIPKNRPFALMFFSPDCIDCQREMEQIIKHMNELKHVYFCLVTVDPFEKLTIFDRYYKLNRYPNIIVGKDIANAFVKHFNPTGTPYSIVYDKERRIKVVFRGEAKINDLINVFKELK
jgi:thiol-disulfide isomerase/thioredoxin